MDRAENTNKHVAFALDVSCRTATPPCECLFPTATLGHFACMPFCFWCLVPDLAIIYTVPREYIQPECVRIIHQIVGLIFSCGQILIHCLFVLPFTASSFQYDAAVRGTNTGECVQLWPRLCRQCVRVRAKWCSNRALFLVHRYRYISFGNYVSLGLAAHLAHNLFLPK